MRLDKFLSNENIGSRKAVGTLVHSGAVAVNGQAVRKSDIQINQDPGNIIQMPASAQLSDVVRALNGLGATPQDLLAILQAIKAAGALNAELEVI